MLACEYSGFHLRGLTLQPDRKTIIFLHDRNRRHHLASLFWTSKPYLHVKPWLLLWTRVIVLNLLDHWTANTSLQIVAKDILWC